ncbi:flagellin N-terminal helical domain-containing protein [Nocardioides pacificus]
MSLRINQNIDALNSYRNLSVTQGQMSKSLEKLSSGFRINRAADDAAGLAISEGLRSQVGGLKVAVRNTQDGVSVVQTAEGALTETHSILQRMRDLSVQGANTGSLDQAAKDNIQSEMGQLKSELTRIADTTKFSGQSLLDGKYDGKFQVGANTGENISVKVAQDMSATGLGVQAVDVSTVGGTTAATSGGAATVDTTAGTASVQTVTANLTTRDGFDDLNGVISVNGKSFDLASVKYAATDDDVTKRTTALNTQMTAALGAGAATATVSGSNLVVTGAAAKTAGAGVTENAAELGAREVKFTQASGADVAIKSIDKAIAKVSTSRADLGALQNRFEHTINNLNVAVENLSASESRIRDTDMASEMMNFTRSQILSQAGTAMLAQANQAPQGVLSLLR